MKGTLDLNVTRVLEASDLALVATVWSFTGTGPDGDPAQARERLTSSFSLLTLAIVVPVLAFAGYLWWLGARIVRAERFPLPGLRVVRDTAVVEGADARRWGRVAQALAVTLTVVVAGLVFFLWRLLALLGS